ncbi:hypothetical protein HZB74_03570 [Candidatus Saccharibacteria bacterium]|nr:hypothetical protein [Candidatus Saccharibacteria bacterium]
MIKNLILGLSLISALFMPVAVSAASVDILDDVCRKQPSSAACEDRVGNSEDNRQNPIYGPNGVITKIVNVLTILVGITAVIAIIVAGIKFITSGSNSQEVTRARELIIYAIVGLIVAAFAQIMVRYVLDNVL